MQVRLLGETPDNYADFGKMDCGRLADRAARLCLQQHIDERAAFKGLFAKPAIEYVENRQQPRLGASGAPPIHDTLKRFEATGSPIMTNGEQRLARMPPIQPPTPSAAA